MTSLTQHLPNIRSPFGGQKVYKDECVFCFDTPECDTGLYVCMNRFLGFGKKFVESYYNKTGNAVFLHLRSIKRQVVKKEAGPSEKKQPTRLAIGVEGGFNVDEKDYEIEEKNCIVVLPEWKEIALDDPDLPGEVQIAASAILSADSAAKQEELATLAGTWDGEQRAISKHAEKLLQLDNGKKIPPSGWKCERCDKKDNLWLNLTDGSILCGRKFWDGTGGNNHAVEHYSEVKYPLAVKLGTITPDNADVFSYDEDDMVLDPNLAKHLAHWGIDIMQMEKTDKTMTELEIEGNQRIGEWDVIQEAGSKLEPVYGPGYTGMRNLGNSCYMNSVLQVLLTIPDLVQRYYDSSAQVFNDAPTDSTQDFNVQMCKLAYGLLSGDYSKPPAPKSEDSTSEPAIVVPEGIRPQMFKALIGKGHAEFSTKRQQDAQEFLLHLLNLIERNSRGVDNPVEGLKFQVEDRIECTDSKKVNYKYRDDIILPLPIPLEAVTNREEVAAYEAKKAEYEAQKKHLDPKELVRPSIPIEACLEAFSQPEFITDFYSTAIDRNTTAKKKKVPTATLR